MSWSPEGGTDPAAYLAEGRAVGGQGVTNPELREFFDLAEAGGFITSTPGDGEKYLRVHLTGRGQNCLRVTAGDIERYRIEPWDGA